jgi:putative nucleotidyltransferase with HDIG domain
MKTMSVQDRMERLKELPTLPNVVQKISQMVESKKTSAEDVGKIISTDQVLTAKVLKLINSAFYGFPGRISSVKHGLVLLGFNVVKGLVLSASVFDMMEGEMVDLWEHSLGTAITSGIIARKLKIKDPEEVSVAGLLHDIGKVVIKVSFPEEYKRIRELVDEQEMSMIEAEKSLLETNHPRLASWLCEKWNLPPNLKDPITYHHSPSLAKAAPKQTAIIHFADILVKGKGFGYSGDKWVPPLDKNAWKLLELSKDDIEEIIASMDTDLEVVDDLNLSS